MRYESYATESYYLDTYEGILIPEDEIEKALKQASRHVDSLTYNRIVAVSYTHLDVYKRQAGIDRPDAFFCSPARYG